MLHRIGNLATKEHTLHLTVMAKIIMLRVCSVVITISFWRCCCYCCFCCCCSARWWFQLCCICSINISKSVRHIDRKPLFMLQHNVYFFNRCNVDLWNSGNNLCCSYAPGTVARRSSEPHHHHYRDRVATGGGNAMDRNSITSC